MIASSGSSSVESPKLPFSFNPIPCAHLHLLENHNSATAGCLCLTCRCDGAARTEVGVLCFPSHPHLLKAHYHHIPLKATQWARPGTLTTHCWPLTCRTRDRHVIFREEFDKWCHLQSESDKAEWVYWANHLKTADSTNILYNHLLGKAGTRGKHRRMSWACICAVLCNPRWSEKSIRNGGKGKGWAARAAAACPNANIWRGQPNDEQADAVNLTPTMVSKYNDPGGNVTNPFLAAAQSARYKSQLKATRGKAHDRTITQRLYDRMGNKAQTAKSFKSRDTGGEMKKLQDALHRRDRMIKESDATIKLLKSKLSEQKELFEGSDPRITVTGPGVPSHLNSSLAVRPQKSICQMGTTNVLLSLSLMDLFLEWLFLYLHEGSTKILRTSELWDTRTLSATYLLYKIKVNDNKNRPIDLD
ncbi:hypothetical protein FBULB1_3909 [Fusarium bulbicola]|nr:hypothetical protein FBULB1_3909 [Fusarium bulbicola]